MRSMTGPDPVLTARPASRRVAGAIGRHGTTVIAMAVGGALTIVGSLAPWVRTGQRSRHSFDLFALVERLGFAPDGFVGGLIRWWPVAPLLVVTAVVTAWWGWRRVGGVLGVVAGLYAGGVGVAVATARTVVEIRSGPLLTTIGAVVLAVAAAATCIVSPPGRTPPTHPGPPAPPSGPPAGRS